jgi:hypothetical protein
VKSKELCYNALSATNLIKVIMQTYYAFQGSVKELISQGVRVNGVSVDAVSLSIMSRFGIAKEIGVKEKAPGTRGRAGKIFKLQGKPGFVVTADQGN